MTRAFVLLLSLLVPAARRAAWREEWLAEMQHGGRRMITGAVPDIWMMRRLAPRSKRARPLQGLGHDLRYSLRGLLASPGFVLGVVLSLTLGIGGNVVAFSFINAAVFRPFPAVHAQHELVRIGMEARDQRGFAVFLDRTGAGAALNLESLRGTFTTLSGLSAHHDTDLVVSVDGQASTGPGAVVSSNYFEVLGLRPAAGRFFTAVDDNPGGEPTAVISYAAWQRLFHADPSAVGKTITVNAATVHVIGVAPEHFIGVRKGDETTDVWIPLGLAELTLRDPAGRPIRASGAHSAQFDFVGRRRPEFTLEQVNAQALVLASQLRLSGSPEYTYDARAIRVWLNDPAESAPEVVAFMIIPMLVLAIACVNAANLLLARAARQTRDWTVRLALGASRWRILRQVLTEATVLAFASAALALVVARWAMEFVARQIPVPLPIDYRVATFTLVISLAAAVAFSLGPAIGVLSRAAKRSVTGTASVSLPRSRVRFSLVALQAALSLGLLTTGAQFTNTVFGDNPNAAAIPAPERLVLASFDLDPLRMTPAESQVFYDRLVNGARQLPGVSNAGVATPGLASGVLGRTAPLRMWAPGAPAEGSILFTAMLASPGALDAIAVPLVGGRQFSGADAERLQSVIVNEPFAKRFFDGSALGRAIRVSLESSGQSYEVTIVGVAGGIMKRADSEPPIMYHPVPLGDLPARSLYLRLDSSGGFSADALYAAVRGIDARVPVNTTSTLADLNAERHREKKLLARGAAALGILALILAAGGLYGVVSYVVSLRRQELGIRIALGAEKRAIMAMITRQALTPASIGAGFGLLGAGLASKVIQSNLYGASAMDPRAFTGSTVLLLGVLFLATIVPASRAARVNPVDTLRTD